MMKDFVLKFRNEFIYPKPGIFRELLSFIYRLKNSFKKTKYSQNENPILIWDITSNSITFDFVFVVFFSANRMKEKGFDNFDIIFYIPDKYQPKEIKWNSYSKYVNKQDMILRFESLIIPIAKSIKYIEKINIINSKDDLMSIIDKRAYSLPENYNVDYFRPEPLDYLQVHKILTSRKGIIIPYINISPIQSKEFSTLEDSLNNDSFITITLRDYGYSPNRNTDSDDITKAYSLAKCLNCKLIIVPDNLDNFNKYKIPRNSLISFSSRKFINDRITLYSKSILNIFTPSGPSTISMFSKESKTIIINYAKEGSFDGDIKYLTENYGIHPGDQPYLRLNCYLMWHFQYPNYNYKDLLYSYQELCR